MNRYGPWYTIRKAMGKRDARYTLEGMMEMDEGHFKVESGQVEKDKGKRNVLVMAEGTPMENPGSDEKSKLVRYFKSKVPADQTSRVVKGAIGEFLDERFIVFTDKSTSHVDISDFVELHITEKSNRKTTEDTLEWVCIFINNANRIMT